MNFVIYQMLTAAALLLQLLSPPVARAQASKDTLVVGMSQYPASLHPGIESTVAKTLVTRFGYRTISAYNSDRKMQCYLCTEVPSIANGRAKILDLGAGKKWTQPQIAQSLRINYETVHAHLND